MKRNERTYVFSTVSAQSCRRDFFMNDFETNSQESRREAPLGVGLRAGMGLVAVSGLC